MADYAVLTGTIAADGTKTNAVNISTFFISHIEVPASMTGTALTFEVGGTTSTLPLRDEENAAISITIDTTAAVYPFDARLTAGVEFIKVVSGSAEASARTIKFYGYRV